MLSSGRRYRQHFFYACDDRDGSFRLKWFLNDGLLNPKSSEIGIFFCMILVAYLGRGNSHPVLQQ